MMVEMARRPLFTGTSQRVVQAFLEGLGNTDKLLEKSRNAVEPQLPPDVLGIYVFLPES